MDVVLFGAQAGDLREEIRKHPLLRIVGTDPEVVICFGGDGTLLAAELRWPGVPKVPIRNSRRGRRCLSHPAPEVIERLANNRLVATEFLKLECAVYHGGETEPTCYLTAMNEFNVHMGRINSAVRFKLWLNDEAYQEGEEVLGDGFVICTPFGSTAYFNQITRGLFHAGLGIAFKYTAEHTNHLIVPEETVVRARITRGPAVLAFDNAPEYFDIEEGDELVIQRHARPAVLLTWESIRHPCAIF